MKKNELNVSQDAADVFIIRELISEKQESGLNEVIVSSFL